MKQQELIQTVQELQREIERLKVGAAKARTRKSRGLLFLFTALMLLFAAVLAAENIINPHSFKNGEILSELSLNKNFDALFGKVNQLDDISVPLGGIIAWHRDFAGQNPALPGGFVKCDGQVLVYEGSPYDGETVPNLNGAAGNADSPGQGTTASLFLRGGTLSGPGERDAFQNHNHAATISVDYRVRMATNPDIRGVEGFIQSGTASRWDGSAFLRNFGTSVAVNQPIAQAGYGSLAPSAETRPKSMSVIWIMRVK